MKIEHFNPSDLSIFLRTWFKGFPHLSSSPESRQPNSTDQFSSQTTPSAIATIVLVSIVFVQGWSIIAMLRVVPAWITRMSGWEVAVTASYTQLFSLVESIVLALVAIVVASLLSRGDSPRQFVTVGIVSSFSIALCAAAGQYLVRVIRLWPIWMVAVCALCLILSSCYMVLIVTKSQSVAVLSTKIGERMRLLAGFYILIDVIGGSLIVANSLGWQL